ncbi:unnamed protein product [Rotaria sordida]|uniref:Uncharacterized protein n=1 Tax=Rotaria sordida TaxID=392033 RepID=A0A815M6C4_9BILA|nr:unnamed protein product [Rotaria sordida]CAF1321820.1 unnamed protein product [Rotaria sordida]CAF1413666.1 unnamed protein product [Rotaria sordida]CAF1586219.1 unnamed protein product [Rotaria sordida]CAF3794947.1 unnamed protein product [Rotaria sordida]
MIGAFTVVTTLQESRTARLQRDADMTKLERQAQLQQETEKRQREVDALKMKEQQHYNDLNAKEIRMQNIYDTFMKDMSSIVLKDNSNITMQEILYARAKTLLALEQLDVRRKWFLIKFLYDSQLLYDKTLGMRYIDLSGVDLSHVTFGSSKKFSRRTDLHHIRLLKLQLRNATFENVALNQANFEFSDLNSSTFIGVSLAGANFQETILENSRLILFSLQNSTFKNSKLRQSSWLSTSPTELLIFSNIDYSNCDLSESTFQNIVITAGVLFDRTNFEQVKFFNIKFSTGTMLNNLNMNMSKFVEVRLLQGKFLHCNMIGAIIEKPHFKNVLFEYVDLQQSQFNDISDSGNLQFNHVNLIGSNLNITSNKITRIADSFLPNGTFKTSFIPFGMNLIKNGDAEQGSCFYHTNLSSIAPVIQSWSTRVGDVTLIYYKNSDDWKMRMSNNSDDWQSCFFFGGYRKSNVDEHVIRQEINVEQLSVLINRRQAGYQASAYLGGFEDEQSSTSLKIGFKNTKNKIEYAIVGPVTHLDRQNKTAMLFRSFNGTVPNDTILISFELKFHRQRSHSGLRFGMADHLKFIIQQK